MSSTIDTSKSHETKILIPPQEHFYKFLAYVLSKIKVYGVGEEGKNPEEAVAAKVEAAIVSKARTFQNDQERTNFYSRVEDIFSTFFGLEYVESDVVAQQIRELVALTFKDIAGVVDLSEVPFNHMKGAVRDAMAREERQARTSSFDSGLFIQGLYGDNDLLEKSKLAALLNSTPGENGVTPLLPPAAKMALERFLRSFKPDRIPKKSLLGVLKSAAKTDGVVDLQKLHVVKRLQDLVVFLESLKGKPDITDMYLLDYLRGVVEEEEAVKLLGHQENTLHEAVLRSRYNGNLLANNAFVQRMAKETNARTLINAMSDEDFVNIAEALIQVASGELDIEDLYLRTGIGGSVDNVPLRMLSYIISSVTIAQRFFEKYGKVPHVELFTGEEGAIACNGMDPGVVRGNTQQAFGISRKFVDTFYPSIADHFTLVSDREWTTSPRQLFLINYLESLLRTEVASNPQLAKIIGELERRGAEHGANKGKSTAIQYAVFHIICFQDIPSITAYLDDKTSNRSHIISIGGAAEREFDFIRDLLVHKFNANDFNQFVKEQGREDLQMLVSQPPLKTRASMITGTGIIPPYYLAESAGDIAVKEIPGSEASPDEVYSRIGRRLCDALEVKIEALRPASQNPKMAGSAVSFTSGFAIIAAAVPPRIFSTFVTTLQS